MSWNINNPQGFESRKIKYLLPKYTRGRVLEIGCGTEKAYPHFIGYDSGHHFGKGAADIVGDAGDLSLFADEVFDAVFSSHVLEHMENMQDAITEWSRVLRVGGYLCLYVPSANLYPRVGEEGANPDHKHNIYPGDIENMLAETGCEWETEISEERSVAHEYSILVVAKLLNRKLGLCSEKYQPIGKTACVCRFGGFGDMLQTAVVFPRLKEQGYRVTVMTTPKGMDVIKDDPHVDDWHLLDTDQIPNHELHDFWKVQAGLYDRFINLSESIEGHLLALPGRMNHSWPQSVRAKRLNANYHEWTAELAQASFKPCKLFYPADEDRAAAMNIIGKERAFNILWALSGSSIHKFTPHQDAVIARIMLDMPEARVILVGDFACKLLEQGWEQEPRVMLMSDKLTIRETLTLSQLVNLVIGPETGVLNAVGMDKNPHKIIFLSHSSANNLTKHWENTQALTPIDCNCFPCHQMHYNADHCQIDDLTCAAKCAVNIGADVIYQAVEKVYRKWRNP